MAGHMILVHAAGMVGDDDIRLDTADDIAHLKAHGVVVGQKTVGVIQHDGLAAQIAHKGLRLGDFFLPVGGDIRPGGRAFFTRRQRQGDGMAARNGAGGKQRAGG